MPCTPKAPGIFIVNVEVLETQLNLKGYGMTLEQLEEIARIRVIAGRICEIFTDPSRFDTIADLEIALSNVHKEVENARMQRGALQVV